MSNNASRVYGDPTKSPTVNVTATVTPLQALRHLGHSVTYAEGCDDVSCNKYNESDVKAAVRKADIVFVCLGTGKLTLFLYQATPILGYGRADIIFTNSLSLSFSLTLSLSLSLWGS